MVYFSFCSKTTLLLPILLIVIGSTQIQYHYYANGQPAEPSFAQLPTVKDPNLRVEEVFRGVKFPTSMAFLGPGDILVLEKNEGTVKRIVNGSLLTEPLLDVSVANQVERGMLGMFFVIFICT